MREEYTTGAGGSGNEIVIDSSVGVGSEPVWTTVPLERTRQQTTRNTGTDADR